MCLKLRHAKFQRSNASETFSYSGLNGRGVGKICIFQRKTGHISETLRLLLITNIGSTIRRVR